MTVEYRPATLADLEYIWDQKLARHPDDPQWLCWREEFLWYNRTGAGVTWVVAVDGVPVGEGTLLLDPACGAIRGRLQLADGKTVGNVNALRIEKRYEGLHLISAMMHRLEEMAREKGLSAITIGVEEKASRNRAIYRHWGYTELLFTQGDGGETVLYYRKNLTP